jgi:hypothetical protein
MTNGSQDQYHMKYHSENNEFNTEPSRTQHQSNDLQGFAKAHPNHNTSEPRKVLTRNPLEVNVNPYKKKFEAVDPFASNNPYSKTTPNELTKRENPATSSTRAIGSIET